jgi:dolichyl-diphosphooligosaccharide--protein glycosyltransferase
VYNRYFGPISNRVRSLFIKHTHTGNPLVDSVAEHQATKPEAYWLYFHLVFYGTPIGFVLCCVQIYRNKGMQDAKWFLLLYTLATAYFSRKMVRLILILAPAAAICSGLVVAACVEWAHAQLMNGVGGAEAKAAQAKAEAAKAEVKTPASEKKANKKKESKKTDEGHLSAQVAALTKFVKSQYAYHTLLRKAVAVVLLLVMAWGAVKYYRHCDDMSANLSEPQIMIRGRARDGSFVIIDDFRESYWWTAQRLSQTERCLTLTFISVTATLPQPWS